MPCRRARYSAYTRTAWQQLVPRNELARGMLFLGTGFAALIGGVAVNWVFRIAPKHRQPCTAHRVMHDKLRARIGPQLGPSWRHTALVMQSRSH